MPKILHSKHYPSHLPPMQLKTLSHTFTNHIPPHRPRQNLFVLGLGSNLARSSHSHPIDTLESVFVWIASHPLIQIVESSPIYHNPPFGYTQQDDFYNALLVCHSTMSLGEIFTLIFYLERRFGRERKRAFKNAPRTLDVDLIFFNNLRLRYKHLQLPHRCYKQRSSVLVPWSFLELFA